MDLKTLSEIPPWEWPDDAGETLLHTLRDTPADEEERLAWNERVAARLASQDP